MHAYEGWKTQFQGRCEDCTVGTHYFGETYCRSFVQSHHLHCKISPCSDVKQWCCRDSSLLWKCGATPEIFAEELLQNTCCFLSSPFHTAHTISSTNLSHGTTLWRNASKWISKYLFFQVAIWWFPGAVLMSRYYSSEFCSTTEKETQDLEELIAIKKNEKQRPEPNQEEFPLLCWRELLHHGPPWGRSNR